MIRRPRRVRQSRTLDMGRLFIALAMAAFAIISFLGSREYNPVTGEDQYVGLTTHQEIALGLQSAPEMIRQYGGLHPDDEAQALIDQIGFELVANSIAADTDWQWEFHLLNDPDTVNAFALPGGQIFITTGLLLRLETQGQVAGVLGHEIVHVLARHSAQQIAKSDLTQGLVGAVVVASQDSAQSAAMIGQLVNMQFGRDDELESDALGVRILAETGYDPRAMIDVMEILAEASGGARQPEFFSTHPNPDNRIAQIQQAIRQIFPDGVPNGLVQ